jgi:hypothetical protein
MNKTVLATLTALAFTGCINGDGSTSSDGALENGSLESSSVQRDLARLRAATAQFRDIAAAEAAGYADSGLPCIDGQGFHWLKGSLLGNHDVTTPAALMYVPTDDGEMRLIAVEWITPISSSTQQADHLFGQTFHGPEHVDGVPFDFFGLHVWSQLNNRTGLFSDTNPRIRCADLPLRD